MNHSAILKICWAEVDETIDPYISTLYIYFNYDYVDYSYLQTPNIIYTKADYIYLETFKEPTIIYLN